MFNKKLLLVSCVFGALAACGGADSEAPTTPEPAVAPVDEAPAEATLPVLTIYEGDKVVMELKEDGSLFLTEDNKTVGTLSADGTFTTTDSEHTAKLADDGTIQVDGETIPVQAMPDGSVTGEGVPEGVKLQADGSVSGQNEHVRQIRIEGATTDRHRQIAMYIMVLTMHAGEHHEKSDDSATAPEPVEAEPAVEPTEGQ